MRETLLHTATVRKLRRLGLLFAHPANGGARRRSEASLLSAMGLQAGVPDLLVFTPPPLHPAARGVAIELKAPGGRLSPQQRDWLAALRAAGWCTAVCYNEQAVDDFLVACGWPLPQRSAAPGPVPVSVGAAEPGGATAVVE